MNGEATRAKVAREFIEIVGGLEFLTDGIRAAEMAMILDNLTTAHHGWNNFSTEAAPAKLLHRLVPLSGNIPGAISWRYVKTITMCRIGGYAAWIASRDYDDWLASLLNS